MFRNFLKHMKKALGLVIIVIIFALIIPFTFLVIGLPLFLTDIFGLVAILLYIPEIIVGCIIYSIVMMVSERRK